MTFTLSCSSGGGGGGGDEPSSSSAKKTSSSSIAPGSSARSSSSSATASSSSLEPSYDYCITEYGCLTGPFTASTCNGQLSNNCPSGSSPSVGSSSSLARSSSSVVVSSPSSSSVAPSSSSAFPSSSSVAVPSSSSSSPQTSVVHGTPVTYQGETYQTVVIGTQTWMARNLNYGAEGSRCYNDDPANCAIYGRLYNWSTAMSVCPSGWHLPSDAEWDVLETAVGGSSTAGTKLKAASGWNNGGNGTDAYGFAALPGGYGLSTGVFNLNRVGKDGDWWSAAEYNAANAWRWHMGYDVAYVSRYSGEKGGFVSVRCVQD